MKKNSERIAFIGKLEPLTKKIFSQARKDYHHAIFIDLSSKRKKIVKNIFNFKVHEFEKIINLLNRSKIKNVCLIGSVNRPNLTNIKVDDVLIKYINQLILDYKTGDGQILKSIIYILKKEGLNVKSLKQINRNFYLENKQRNLVFVNNKSDHLDIAKGVSLLKSISKYDNAQSVVISNGYILGIEAVEGTDSLLKRVILEKRKLKLNKREGILIKISKTTQSNFADNPVVGPKTISLIIKSGLNGIAIKKSNTIFFDREKVLNLMKQSKVNLYLI